MTLPLTPVHQVLKHCDAEWVLQVPGAKSEFLELLVELKLETKQNLISYV